MARKRKRTAWHAVSESRPMLYHPSQTSATYTVTAVHIGTAPAQNDAARPRPSSSSPSSPSSSTASPCGAASAAAAAAAPPSPGARDAIDAGVGAEVHVDADADGASNDDAATRTPPGASPAPSTPLVVTAADVSAARRELGLTPRTPSSTSTVFLDRRAAAAARALLFSTRRAAAAAAATTAASSSKSSSTPSPPPRPSGSPNAAMPAPTARPTAANGDGDGGMGLASPPDGNRAGAGAAQQHAAKEREDKDPQATLANPLVTPIANRRLSTGSAVTPIALNFESPRAPPPSAPAAPPAPAADAPPDGPPATSAPLVPAPALASPITPATRRNPHHPLLADTEPPRTTTKTITTSSIHHHHPPPLPPPPPPSNGVMTTSLFSSARGKKLPLRRGRIFNPFADDDAPVENTTTAVAEATAVTAAPLFTTGRGAAVIVPNTFRALSREGEGENEEDGPVPQNDNKDDNADGRVHRALPLFSTGNNVPVAGPLFTTGKGVPVPIPAPAPAPSFGPLFTTGKGVPVPIPAPAPAPAPALGPLFTTGKGVPVPIPEPAPAPALGPLFTTGKGVPVPVPAAAAVPASGPLFTTGKGVPVELPRDTVSNVTPNARCSTHMRGATSSSPQRTETDSPLFTTGKGVPIEGVPLARNGGPAGEVLPPSALKGGPVSVLRSAASGTTATRSSDARSTGRTVRILGSGGQVTPPSTVRTPAHAAPLAGDETPLINVGQHAFRNSSSGPLFSTAGGQRVSARSSEHSGILLQGLVTPNSKTPSTDGLRKTLFRESGARSMRRSSGRGSGIKSTPFKRPRNINRSPAASVKEGDGDATKQMAKPVPKIAVPALLTSGRIVCTGRGGHVCEVEGCNNPQNSKFDDSSHVSLREKPGCLSACAKYEFDKSGLGPVDCLPGEAAVASELWEAERFGVSNCVSWVRRLFPPAVSDKPATTVGSRAWTTLCYALSVWKLCRLEYGSEEGEFVTATNVVRELLKRMQWEWHSSRQPWLLRMLRRDTSPASHAVLRLADVEGVGDSARLVVTDGWYVARATMDAHLCKRLLSGWLRIGDKFHMVGATLQSGGNVNWFFGEGDEIADGVFKLHKNGLLRAGKGSHVHMGVHRMLVARSLKWAIEDAGPIAAATVVVLRRYPVAYMQTVVVKHAETTGGNEEVDRKDVVWRREEAEEEARLEFAEKWSRKHADRQERRFRRLERKGIVSDEDVANIAALNEDDDDEDDSNADVDELENSKSRDVISVQEMLVCGVDDDASDKSARKLIRIYKSSEDMELAVRRDLCILHLRHLMVRKGGAWRCKGDAVWEASKRGSGNGANIDASTKERWTFPRRLAAVKDLQLGNIASGEDFDGAFYVIHDHGNSNEGLKDGSSGNAPTSHFVYLVDDTCGDSLTVLALQLCSADARSVPRILRTQSNSSNFSVVGLRDVTFGSNHANLDIVQARTTLRSSFLTTRGASTSTQSALRQRILALELRLQNADAMAQLDILREAVVSFASGKRASIAAYFSSTQQSTGLHT